MLELKASIVANILALILTYPLETIRYRMAVQLGMEEIAEEIKKREGIN